MGRTQLEALLHEELARETGWGGWADSASTVPLTPVTPLTFTRNSTEDWIYCNYPEQIDADGIDWPFGDEGYGYTKGKGYYLNQQTVSGTVEIFFSHDSVRGGFSYGIQLYNPSATPVTVTKTNQGFTQSWDANSVWDQYFFPTAPLPTSYYLEGYHSTWIFEEAIRAGTPFCGSIQLQCPAEVLVTVYAFKDKTKLTGDGEAYKYNNKDTAYTGLGAGFFSYSTVTLNSDELLASPMYCANGHSSLPNVNDIIPIRLYGSDKTASADAGAPLDNLANWGAHNSMTFVLNNRENRPMRFRGVIQGERSGANIVIQADTLTQGKVVKSHANSNGWMWFDQVVPANTLDQFTVQLIMASYGNGPIWHKFTCENA